MKTTITEIDTMIATLRDNIDRFRAMRVRQKSRYWRATAELPATLYPYWKRSAQFEFKGIPRDAFFFARATEGLLNFFDCVRASGKPCALPSVAADSVWHAWMRMSPASLDAFCIKHFGKPIPHVEAAEMGTQMEAALANCMVTARRLEKRDLARPSVPRLFALDADLCMPGGFGYRLAQGRVACRRLDKQGRPAGEAFYPAGLEPVELLGAGLVTQSWFDWNAKKAKSDGGGCGGGSPCGTRGSCDRGRAGGRSCGSGGGGGGCGSGAG
jgi:hypothetical protein